MRNFRSNVMVLVGLAIVACGCTRTVVIRQLTPEQEAWAQQLQRWHPGWERPYVAPARDGGAAPADAAPGPMEEGVWGLPARPPAPLSAPVPVEPDLSVPAYAPVLPPMPAPDSDFTIEPFEAAPLPPVAETEEFAFPALPAEILPATVAPAPETYRVKKGDTLSGIARKLYGDPHAWRPIFEANRDILSSPDKLRPDMTLTIPPAP